jgi:hypothetical protein
MRMLVLSILAGCSGGEGPPCTWCAPEAPYVRTCRDVMVAAGDQPVCVDGGETHLCQPASACGP